MIPPICTWYQWRNYKVTIRPNTTRARARQPCTVDNQSNHAQHINMRSRSSQHDPAFLYLVSVAIISVAKYKVTILPNTTRARARPGCTVDHLPTGKVLCPRMGICLHSPAPCKSSMRSCGGMWVWVWCGCANPPKNRGMVYCQGPLPNVILLGRVRASMHC